nr:hypothetical protein [Tanacetum cinerariifolium]
MHTFMHMLVAALVDTIMSDSEDSTVTYTTALPPPNYVLGLEEPDQAPPSPVYIPYPLFADASPTVESPGYIPESDPDEDPKEDDDEDPEEDPADYPADHDDEEEEHPASADSIPPPPALRVTARISFKPQPPTLAEDIGYGIIDTWIDPRDVAE